MALPAIALKYLALLSMLSDHIYKVFRIPSPAMAVFGRLAFPIFCYLSSVGFRKTRSRAKYLARLFICAMISEIPFDMLWRRAAFDFSVQNVCFTLFLGGLSCVLYEEIRKTGGRLSRFAALAAAAVPVALAGVLHTDYGSFGAGLLFLLFLSGGNKPWAALSLLAFDAALCASRNATLTGFFGDIQHFCLLALPLILTASGRRGIARKTGKSADASPLKPRAHAAKSFIARYYFYVFYPLHMALLALIRWALRAGVI